jgi:hypothetical protein
MSTNNRTLGIYAASGIGIAIILIAAIFASGIPLSPDQNQTGDQRGTLWVSIKDAPVELHKLVLTINGIYILSADEDSWTELFLKDGESMEFDLLELTGEKSLKLTEQEVPAGDYSRIRLVITEAIATYTDNRGEEFTAVPLRVPPGHIDIITNFNIDGGELTALMIDMQPDTAAISNSGNFRPIIKMAVIP